MTLATHTRTVCIVLDDLRKVELIESDPEFRNYWVANGRFTDQNYEMLCYLTNDRLHRPSDKYLTPAEKLPPSETQGLGQLDVKRNTHHNLPEQPGGYVNPRSKRNWRSSRPTTIELTGRGGIGKTSTAPD